MLKRRALGRKARKEQKSPWASTDISGLASTLQLDEPDKSKNEIRHNGMFLSARAESSITKMNEIINQK